MSIINYFANPESYNSGFFPAVYDAALAIASPFLVQQKNQLIEGATVDQTTVEYNGTGFTVYTNYINPGTGYYTGTPAAFGSVWQTSLFPNAVYDPAAPAFNATIDCVGFGSRVLIAVGGDNPQGNAFCLFHSQADPAAVHFAVSGIVPTAFEFAVALPVMLPGRWTYVSGCVNASVVQENANQANKNYTGVSKGGFSKAQAGDILCFGYTTSGSNGHFMVLTEAPQEASLDTFKGLPGFVTNIYLVSVYDSTAQGSSLHFRDSRQNDLGTNSGVGYGQLYLFTNAADEPVGFVFGPDDVEYPHFVSGLVAPEALVVAAISVGRFE